MQTLTETERKGFDCDLHHQERHEWVTVREVGSTSGTPPLSPQWSCALPLKQIWDRSLNRQGQILVLDFT